MSRKWILALAAAGWMHAQAPDPLAAGKRVFDSQCALCHGIGGTGGRGPALTSAKMRHADDLFGVIIGGIEGSSMPAFWFLGDRPVFQVAAYVRSLSAQAVVEKLPGDPVHGKALFAAKGCSGCHVVQGEGKAFGPELSEIGARRSPAFLRESIVDPAASVPEDFVMVRVKTRSGETVSGVRLNEDSFSIQIRDARGRFHSFRKQDLADLHKDFDKSPMPGYRDLPAGDLDDLVAYLASLKERQ